MTDLSIIIPAHNEADSIGDQLGALLAQEWEGDWEIVVVDNRSTDGTRAVVESFGHGPVPVRVVAANERANLNYTRSVGASAARGPAVAYCDADDIAAPGWVAAMGSALGENEFVTGPLELDRLNPRWLADSRGRGDERGQPTFHGIFPQAHGNNMGIRRSALERLGGFGEDVVNGADDLDLSLRAWQAGVELVFVDEAVVHYRYRAEPAALWRQGRSTGIGRPFIRRRLLELGLPAPSPLAGWRSWVWLLVHLLDLRTHEGRATWTWVAANRIGQLEGSIRFRTVML